MPRFDESIKIETGSYDVGSGRMFLHLSERMFLHLSERNDSEGTFVVQGTKDLSPNEYTGVAVGCSDYFGGWIYGHIWW